MGATTLNTTPAIRQAVQSNHRTSTWRYLSGMIGIIATVLIALYLFLGVSYRHNPFLGMLVNRALVVNAGSQQGSTTWPGIAAGIQAGDLIIEINGESLFSDDDYSDYSAAYVRYEEIVAGLPQRNHGEFQPVEISFLRKETTGDTDVGFCDSAENGLARCTVTIDPIQFPDLDLMSYFLLPIGAAILVIILGWTMFYNRSTHFDGNLASALAFLSAIYAGGIFDAGVQSVGGLAWHITAPLMAGVMLSFGMVFPRRLYWVRQWKNSEFFPLFLGAIASMVAAYYYQNPADNWQVSAITQLTTACAGTGLIGMMVASIIQRNRATSPTTRDQSNTIFIGNILLLIPLILWISSRILITNWEATLPINLEALMPLLIFPLAGITYAVLQYRHFDTDRAISQGITYTIMGGALIIAIFLLTLGGALLAIEILNATNVLLISIILFVMVSLFTPVRNHLQERIDAIYFRTRRDLQRKVEEFSRSITALNDYQQVAKEFYDVLRDTIAPSTTFIFLRESADAEGDFVVYQTEEVNTEIRFSSDSPFLTLLSEGDNVISLQAGQAWPQQLRVDQARFKLLGTTLLISIKGTEGIIGFVILGAPKVDRIYSHDEVRFVDNLVSQLAIATQRSRVIESLERRVRELDVLSQVGQAVNFTIEFDDLLELIYAQTSKLLPVPSFYIAMYDERINQLYFAFFLEGDDRHHEKENVRWDLGNDLISEVIKNNTPLRIRSYREEMEKRNAKSFLVNDQLRAWMAVPLTAGRRTLGVIVTGKTEDASEYNVEQFKIFSDIGTLAATSLDKANLFMQTRMRERQLTVLNDISRQLVATESDVEKLLEIIMNSAVEILNAEAGSLLLHTPDESGDLEFRVVVGGGGEGLIGTRIPQGKGVVGQVVSTSEPIIVNDAEHDERHDVDVVDDFVSRSLLAVPLIAQEKVIGVLEVLNKKDRTPFINEDAELLNTFSGQAAIAIENARLFQLTDQQLEQRVRELETLERLDSELNRTLDLNEVAEITVQSAMSILGATAGALGIVNQSPPFLRIVAINGYERDEYPENTEGDDGLIWPLDEGIIARVIRSRQADIVMDVQSDPDYDRGLKGSNSQITLPMMSGNEVNAILMLEKNTLPRFSLPDWAFAQRMAEHASIAIANAQFYNALSLADKSKSEFMGFAAHELKNPLTALIGWADLMRGGAIGELSDQQSNMINVIHSNAKRMETIISDLRDAAKVDAGEFSVHPEPMSVYSAVVETLRPFVQTFASKNQELVNNVPEDLPLILGDETRIIQVLTNLVSNAHKYSHADTTITVGAKLDENYHDRKGKRRGKMVVVSVQDQGLGMSEEDQSKLFKERYFRSTNQEALDQPGTGLGMTLTYNIMQQHNGEIWIESTLGEGSTFFISFPIAEEKQPDEKENQPASEPASD